MPTASPYRAPDLRRLPIAVNLRAISLAEGVRAGLSVAVIIAASEYIHIPALREAALAALLTCLCDSGGPISRRIPALLSFTLIGAAITAGFGLLRGLGPEVAVTLGVFGLFCASFARIYGQVPQQLGILLGVVQILSLDRALPDLAEAAVLAVAFIGGGLWATLLTMVIWRIYPFLPARRAMAEVYRRLSELVRDLHALASAAAISETAWEAHARIHRRAVREAIETARTVVLDTLRARGAASNRAAQSLIRLETADQIFGLLIALSDRLEHGSPDERAAVAPILRRLRPLLLILGRVIVTDDPNAHARMARSIEAITADAQSLSSHTALSTVIQHITDRVCIAQTLAVPANFNPRVDVSGRRAALWPGIMEPMRSNLNWQSPALRHALRIAVTAAPPLTYTMIWFTPYDHWLTITVVSTMQPYFSLTFTRAVERVAGTAAGGVIAAAVGLVCTTPVSIAVAMFPLAIAALAIRAVSFGLFMMVLTPLVVLLVETGAPGTSEWQIAFARAVLTTTGGIIAVAANFLLWPKREPDLVGSEVRQAIAAHGSYAEAEFATILGNGDDALPVSHKSVSDDDAQVASRRAGAPPATRRADPVLAARRADPVLAARRADPVLAARRADPVLAARRADAVTAARRAAGIATNALEALITRALLQPGRSQRDRLEAAMVIDAALRRFVGRMTALTLDAAQAAALPKQALQDWRDWIAAAMQGLAAGRTDLPPRPAGPTNDTLMHIARQIELMAGIMQRLADPHPE